jgi:hypothetical protein
MTDEQNIEDLLDSDDKVLIDKLLNVSFTAISGDK